jgi:hypothetical protein
MESDLIVTPTNVVESPRRTEDDWLQWSTNSAWERKTMEQMSSPSPWVMPRSRTSPQFANKNNTVLQVNILWSKGTVRER